MKPGTLFRDHVCHARQLSRVPAVICASCHVPLPAIWRSHTCISLMCIDPPPAVPIAHVHEYEGSGFRD